MKFIFAAILSWIIPGAGHWYIGERTRAVILFITVTVTFWVGIYIGGVLSTVNFATNRAWFFAHIFLGGYTLMTSVLSHSSSALPSYGKTLDLAVIYTGIAGLLNLLIIIDASARAFKKEMGR